MKEYEQAREVIKETLGASWVDEQIQKRKRHFDSIVKTLGKYSVFDSSKAYQQNGAVIHNSCTFEREGFVYRRVVCGDNPVD